MLLYRVYPLHANSYGTLFGSVRVRVFPSHKAVHVLPESRSVSDVSVTEENRISVGLLTSHMDKRLPCGSKFTQEYLNRAFRKAAKHGTVNELNFLYSLKSMKPDKDQIDKDGRTLLFYPMFF